MYVAFVVFVFIVMSLLSSVDLLMCFVLSRVLLMLFSVVCVDVLS